MWSLSRLKEFTKLDHGRLGAVAPWLLFAAGVVLGAVLGLLVSASNAFTTGLFGLVGVALGGVISAVATERSARVAQFAQIATATWPDRIKKHQEAYLWYQKMISIHFDPPDERIKMSKQAHTWLLENYLYLSEDVRKSLRELFSYYLLPVGKFPSEVTRGP